MKTDGLVMTPFLDPESALEEAEFLSRTEQKTYCIIRRKQYMFVVTAEAARIGAQSAMNRVNEKAMVA